MKTAYEFRISDWSSDVCSSDLPVLSDPNIIGSMDAPIWTTNYPGPYGEMPMADAVLAQIVPVKGAILLDGEAALLQRKVQVVKEIGRASCRERVCQYG